MQAQYPFPMGAPMLAGGTPHDQSGYWDDSNGTQSGYGKDAAQLRRDKARGRHVPY